MCVGNSLAEEKYCECVKKVQEAIFVIVFYLSEKGDAWKENIFIFLWLDAGGSRGSHDFWNQGVTELVGEKGIYW